MAQTASPAITQVHFEVYVLERERWTIGYISTSREEALEEAAELARRPEVAGVRVIKELCNPRTGAIAARTVFEYVRPQCGRIRGPIRAARPRPMAAARPEPAARREMPLPLELEGAPFSWSSLAGLSVIGAVAGGGLAIILALLAAP